MRWFWLPVAGSLAFLLALSAHAQGGRGLPAGPPPGELVVHVLSPMGDPLNTPAIVKIQSNTSGYFRTEATREAARAQFSSIPAGGYQVEATAPGYDPAEERVDVIPGQTARAFITMRPEGYAKMKRASADSVLSPKAQKELEQGLAAMNSGDAAKGKAAFSKVRKMAPGHPEPHFLLGVAAFREGDIAGAEESVRQALSLNPKHAAANALLGRILLRKQDPEGAIAALQASLVEEPDNWQTHSFLGQVLSQKGQFAEAAPHLQRALALSAGKLPSLKVSLAFALAQTGKTDAALLQLDEFISANPQHADIAAARDLRSKLVRPSREAQPAALKIPPPAVIDETLEAESPDWAPEDIDASKSYLTPDVKCSLPDVMAATSKRVLQLTENMQGITANETVEFAELSPKGVPKTILSKRFSYFVSIEKVGPRDLSVDEYRKDQAGSASFPAHLVTNGLAALALIFHPSYSGDLRFGCEGLGQWKGQPAWLIHFQQREGQRSRLRSYRTQLGKFPVSLKGRAWVAANTHEILRLETDLVAPVEKLELEREHITVEYKPVDFRQGKLQLWLPESAEMYAKFGGKRYRQRHQFAEFTYFSVDTRQKISDPKIPEKEPPQP